MGNDLERSSDADGAAALRLGVKLKKHREYLGMSQQYVAECTGIPRSAVSEIEHGNRRVDAVELTKLARLYQVPASWLLDEDEQARADTHALALFTRKFGRLTSEDQAQLAEFAEFLAARRAAREQDQLPEEQR
jgi:transcriptional regulator with XRE-family HTH domain